MCWIILTLHILFLILSVTKLYLLIPLFHPCFPVWYREILFLLSPLCFAWANAGYGVIQWVVQVELRRPHVLHHRVHGLEWKKNLWGDALHFGGVDIACGPAWLLLHAGLNKDSCSILMAQEILYMVSWLGLMNHAFASLAVSAALPQISCCQRLTAFLQLLQVQQESSCLLTPVLFSNIRHTALVPALVLLVPLL